MEVNGRCTYLNMYGVATKNSNTATLPRESHTGFFHPRGSPATYLSIPAGFPRIPQDSRDPHPRAGLYPEMTYNVFSGTLNPTHFTSLHF